MTDLLLDSDGDLDFSSGCMNLVGEREEIAQRLKIKLATVKGEYAYDRSIGTDWYGKILGERNMIEVDAELRRAILSTSGIAKLKDAIQYNRNQTTRVLEIKFTAITISDEEIAMTL